MGPTIMYGTAWKEDATADLVLRALAAGFRAIDTANQRKHYHEAGVGEALVTAYERGIVRREDLFLQSKFTHRAGQDHRLPYDPSAPIASQVHQSLESSLAHLHTTHLDAYVLHGPSVARGLAPEDVEVWRAMEALHDDGRVRALGVSNVTRVQLERLLELARVRPAWVQNRCYARTGWDAAVRDLCRAEGIGYQPFSLLTANRAELSHPDIHTAAAGLGLTVPQLVFRFALDLGLTPITGTTDDLHMRQDLAALRLPPLDASIARLFGA